MSKVSSMWEKIHAPTLCQDVGSFMKTDAWISQRIGCNSQVKNIFVRLAQRKDAFLWKVLD